MSRAASTPRLAVVRPAPVSRGAVQGRFAASMDPVDPMDPADDGLGRPDPAGSDLDAALPDGPALLHDAAGTVVAATAELARLVGALDACELVGRPVTEIVGNDGTRGRLRRRHRPTLPVALVRWATVPGTSFGAVAVVPDADGGEAHDRDPDGERAATGFTGFTGSGGCGGEDARRLRDVQRVARLGSWELDLADGRCRVSPVLAAMLGLRDGLTGGEGPGETTDLAGLIAAVHPTDRDRVEARWRALIAEGQLCEIEFRPADGSGRILHGRAARMPDRGVAGVVVGTVEDVTERRTAELRMRASTQRFTDLLAVAPVGIALFDDRERLVKANQALCRLLGHGPEELRGRRADELLDLAAESAAGPATPLLARPAGSAGSVSWSCAARALRTRERGAHGAPTEPVWCELHVSVSLTDDGAATHLVVFTDVTDNRRVEATLRHQAMHDELTGLPNRRALTTTVSHLLSGPTARRTGVLFCDLDNFKRVNDSLGHDAGDELLVELARRLQTRLPRGCGASRVSGDEFVVVCADVDQHGGLDALSATVAGILRTAIPVHGQLVRVSATVGAAVGATAGIPAGPPGMLPVVDPTDDPIVAMLRRERAGSAGVAWHPGTADLLRFADAARYQAKSGGGYGRFALADEAIMRGADEALRMESQLREALINDELVLHFQPVVGPDGRVVTAEALVRWQHPEQGLIFPDKFLPVAEAADLMGELDRWVLRTAVREAARWPAADGAGDAPSVAVNLAGLLPGDADFLPTVRDAVAESGLPWNRLVLELVETCLADLPPHTLRQMNELIAAGVRFAVDDFGTGYSSLSRLTGLPAQIVKLDRAFVRGVATGESDWAVARAVVDLTAAIGQVCVAEGVEDADQFAVLRDLGVHAYQGWLFARATPADRFRELLREGPLQPGG